MCRNIRTLFSFESPATDEEVRAAAPCDRELDAARARARSAARFGTKASAPAGD